MHFWLVGRDDIGSLWFSAVGGISKFTEQGWIHRDLLSMLPPEWREVMDARYTYDSNNRLWGKFWEYGICIIDSLKTTVFTKEDGMADSFQSFQICLNKILVLYHVYPIQL